MKHSRLTAVEEDMLTTPFIWCWDRFCMRVSILSFRMSSDLYLKSSGHRGTKKSPMLALSKGFKCKCPFDHKINSRDKIPAMVEEIQAGQHIHYSVG